MRSDSQRAISINLCDHSNAVVVKVRGVLGFERAATLHSMLRDLYAHGVNSCEGRLLVLDLAEVVEVDSAGIHAIKQIEELYTYNELGKRLRIVSSRSIQYVLDFGQVTYMHFDSVESAVRQLVTA